MFVEDLEHLEEWSKEKRALVEDDCRYGGRFQRSINVNEGELALKAAVPV
jgi:hypothetical protein